MRRGIGEYIFVGFLFLGVLYSLTVVLRKLEGQEIRRSTHHSSRDFVFHNIQQESADWGELVSFFGVRGKYRPEGLANFNLQMKKKLTEAEISAFSDRRRIGRGHIQREYVLIPLE